MEYDVHEAKTQFSKLLAKVQAGEEVMITKAGKPIARLLPMAKHQLRTPGTEKGVFWVAADFDAPLPDDVIDGFEGLRSPVWAARQLRARHRPLVSGRSSARGRR